MVGASYRCLAQISEARRLYERGLHDQSIALIQTIRDCIAPCGEIALCTAALRLATRDMALDPAAAPA